MRTPEWFDHAGGSDRDAATSTLAVVDEALEAGGVTAADQHERELQELALMLRSEVPVADQQFARRLDARMERGFAPEGRRPVARAASRRAAARDWVVQRLVTLRPSFRIVAGAASLLLALLVGVSVYAGSRSSDSADTAVDGTAMPAQEGEGARGLLDEPAPSAGSGQSDKRSVPSEPDGATAEPLTLPAPTDPRLPAPGDEALGQSNRRVERSASMTLAAPDDRVAEVAHDIPGIVERHRGFVLGSSVTTGDEGTTGGSFDLRVPAAELDATLSDLSDLGQVRSQTQTDDDVTGAFVSVRDRLAAARAERRGLLRRLERASTPAEARATRERLDRATRIVNRVQGSVAALEKRTAFAALTLSLVADDAAASGTDDALRDAAASLLGAFNLAVRVLGFVLPLAIVGGLAWFLATMLRRRRREAALE